MRMVFQAPPEFNRLKEPSVGGGGGGGAPSPSGTIIFDTRAGGAQDYQAISTIGELEAFYSDTRYTGASRFFESNVDGNGTNAFGCQWSTPTGSEQECMLERNGLSAPTSGWYTQFKIWLGKSPTGGGTGTEGHFGLTGGNPHQKLFMWYRTGDTLDEKHRIYIYMLPGSIKLSVDLTSWDSSLWTDNPMNHLGQAQTVTVWIGPDDGTVKAWLGGTLVLDMTGQNSDTTGIGVYGLKQIDQTVTTFPDAQQVQYVWDVVVWYP